MKEKARNPSATPAWKVYFDGNFWGHYGRGKAGKKIPLERQLTWGGKDWGIPAIYLCGKGVVIDFCMRVPAESIRAFLDKWELSVERDGSDFTEEQRMRVDAENPLSPNARPTVAINGKTPADSHSCGLSWNPCVPECNPPEVRGVLEQYGLDPACGWAILRAAFPWTTKRKPRITTLAVTLTQAPVSLPGPHFRVSAPGDCVAFTHPATGAQHRLTVQEYERQEISAALFGDPAYDYPTQLITMSYTLAPDLPGNAFHVTDCEEGDRPLQKQVDPFEPTARAACSIGIIGGADGPTAIAFGSDAPESLRAACSALHFEPVDDVEWRMVFHEATCAEVTVDLM